MNKTFIAVTITTTAAVLAGYLLAYLLLRIANNLRHVPKNLVTQDRELAESNAKPFFSSRGQGFWQLIIFFLCLSGWWALIHAWTVVVEAWPGGGKLLLRTSKDSLQLWPGFPMAFFATVIIIHLIWAVFAPGSCFQTQYNAFHSRRINCQIAHSIAAVVVLLILGGYVGLDLMSYSRFDENEIHVKAPWTINAKAYSYNRIRSLLCERGGEATVGMDRYAIVFDDGSVWLSSDYAAVEENIEWLIATVCARANNCPHCPETVESINTSLDQPILRR